MRDEELYTMKEVSGEVMRQYAPAEYPLQWQTLTPQHMPPIGEEFLLWRACNESDGGFCTIGKRYERRNDAPPIIAYLIGAEDGFRRVLDFDEYKSCRWAAIPPPKCVIKKRIRTMRRQMEMEKQWQKEESEHESQA